MARWVYSYERLLRRYLSREFSFREREICVFPFALALSIIINKTLMRHCKIDCHFTEWQQWRGSWNAHNSDKTIFVTFIEETINSYIFTGKRSRQRQDSTITISNLHQIVHPTYEDQPRYTKMLTITPWTKRHFQVWIVCEVSTLQHPKDSFTKLKTSSALKTNSLFSTQCLPLCRFDRSGYQRNQ